MIIATFTLICLLCVVVMLWIHSMEVGADTYKPTAKQRRQWRRERLQIAKGNRRR